jgi:pimeloyl-ACP methyl ester carboxylesterase
MIASINDQELFHRLIEAGARVICIARPGYGDSSPYCINTIGEWGDLVAVLVGELGLAHFDVLGISSGAPYSYAIANKLPDRVRNVFILSGTPALYDENVLACWPYPVTKNASIAEMQKLAHRLFFSDLSREELERDDIRDSMANDCFGVAQDLRLRCMDWGFRLSDVRRRVLMRHSQADTSVPFITAQITAQLLPDCHLDVREKDPHFSQQVLDDFIAEICPIMPLWYNQDRQVSQLNRSGGN